MKITKHNIKQTIEDFLKSKRIRYSISDEDSLGLTYELFIGYLECFLQVEYDLDAEYSDKNVVVQLFTNVDSNGNSLYSETWENDGNYGSIESEIETLIDETKRMNSVVNKISKKIEQIIELCEDNGLDSHNFLTVHYDFD